VPSVEPAVTRRQAAADVVLTIVLVPLSAIGAGVLIGVFSAGTPNLAAVVLVQALLVLAGVSLILSRREQRFSDIGLAAPRAGDLGRAVIVLLAGFGVNAALTAAVVVLSPQTLEEHIAGLQSLTLDLTAETPLAAVLALLLVVGLYEEVVARGLLLTRSRQLLSGSLAPVLFSAALFAVGHFYQGAYGMLQTALFGVVLAAFTIRWGTLWPAIFAHSAINMLSVLQLGDASLPT